MKKIWAPWRSAFIYNRKRKGCIFCKAKDSKDDNAWFILKRSGFSYAMLNIYPYNNGHIMVVPKNHKDSSKSLRSEELKDLMLLVNEMLVILDKTLKPGGYNIGMNIGKVAGAGYAGHLHIHIIPRWSGDTNFMPVLSDTKVISESLDALYQRLRRCIKRAS